MSYLNTSPLVWGMLHGRQRGLFDLTFRLPSECAERLADGRAELGLVPVMEMARQGLEALPGVGIACRGAVRSILLISRVPLERVRTLAADTSSRTSVELARIVLERRYGAKPEVRREAPDAAAMLRECDAALIIGDPALRIDPAKIPYMTLDLGREWWEMTGLPMVFAVWAGPGPLAADRFRAGDFLDSYRYGAGHLEEIVEAEHGPRGVAATLAASYLRDNIVYELGAREYAGLERFLAYAQALPEATAPREAEKATS